jgi:hypothetical protein
VQVVEPEDVFGRLFFRKALLLLDEAFHSRARLRLGLHAERLEHLLEPLDLTLGFLLVLLEGLPRLAIRGFASHLVERFQQALLGAVDVLQVVFEQLVEGRDWHADAPFV